MSTHNICFHGEIRKILCGYPLLSGVLPHSAIGIYYVSFSLYLNGMRLLRFVETISAWPYVYVFLFVIFFVKFQLLEINHRKIRQLEVKHQNEVRQVQERLGQEEESVIALREEGRLKEQQIAKLKKSLKEVCWLLLSMMIRVTPHNKIYFVK